MGLPAGTYAPATLTLRDAGNEASTFSCYGKVPTTGNIVAQQGLWDGLIAAILAIVLGVREKSTYAQEVISMWTQPTNGAARETKLLVQYQDDTNGQRLTCTVPTLNPALPDYVVNVNARDVIELGTPTEIAAFITAFEAFAVPPLNPSHTVSVVGLKVVGRNS